MNPELQPAFRALGDPTRRAILMQLSQQELTITEVVDRFDLTRTAVRKHLTVLQEGNLITMNAKGRERVMTLNPQGLKSVAAWFSFFDQFWDSALVSLKDAVENGHQKKQTRKKQ